MQRVVLAALALATLAGTARADDDKRAADKGTFGVGIILGEPTGVTAKLYLKDDQALQAAIGAAFIAGGVQGHLDYVFHPVILQQKESFVLPLYVGPGVWFFDHTGSRDEHYFGIGLRAVVGLLFDFKTVPLDAFIEAAAVFDYGFKSAVGFEAHLNVGAGARFYF
jgi:hypothetical protein